jgi:glycosyltransferase involved in cell wall biosynthesis
MRILILSGHPEIHLGGSELQCDVLAGEWVALGHEVLFGALDASPQDCLAIERDYPVQGIPERSMRWLLDVILAFEPDVIYWRAGRFRLWNGVLAARMANTRFVFSMAARSHAARWSYTPGGSDGSLVGEAKSGLLKARQLMRSRVAFEAYRAVDGLSSNLEELFDDLPDGPGITPNRATIYNAIDPGYSTPFQWPRPYVVWVANLKKCKNPDVYVEAARRLRDELDVDFLMVGGIHQEEYRYVAEPGRVPDNFHYLGPRTPEEVNAILAGSVMLVHTCDPEGFPGNFVQAWWQGVPTISLYYDPDGVIETHGVGRLSGEFDTFVEDIVDVATHPRRRDTMGQRAYEMACDLFDATRNARRYERFFEGLLTG